MELVQRIFVTALGAAAIFYLFVKWRLSHWKQRGILHEKPKLLWGNIKGVGKKRNLSTILQQIYLKYKGQAPFIGFYAFIKPFVLVLDLNLVQSILQTDAAFFMTRGLYHNTSDEPLSCNLMQLDGQKWSQLHAKVSPAFAKESIAQLLPHLLQVAANFKRSLDVQQKKKQIFVINDLVDSYNIDVISTLAFGLTGDTLHHPNTEFRAMTRSYQQNFSLLKAYLALEFPTLARLLQYRSYDQLVSQYFVKMINDKRKERDWNHRQKQPLMQYDDFLKLFTADRTKRNSKLRLSDEEIAAQAFTFVLTGMEPCNATLAFCLYELALQPELQEKARTEIAAVLKQDDGQLTVASLQEFKYVKQILKETLRLHSPYPFLLRRTVEDYDVPDSVFMLCKGNNVIIPIAAIHHDPVIYPEPLRFDPARFEQQMLKQRHPMAFLPFGAGPRSCIALHFAEAQLLVGLVTLLQHYLFKPCADTEIPLRYNNEKILLSPQTDIRLVIERVVSN